MTKCMTEGSPLRLIMNFALPLLLGNLCQQTYNMVDAAIVGQTLGADALAGVGASSSVQFLVLGFCIGIACGFAVPVAQAFGANELPLMRRYIWHSVVLTVCFAAALTVLCVLLCPAILHLLQTPDSIFPMAYQYLLVIFIGIPCTLLYNLCSSVLRAVGDSRTPFYFLAFSAFLNIGLDFFCILVLGWGVAGAAIATVFSQGLSGVLCVVLIFRKFRVLIPSKNERTMSRQIAGRTLAMGVPMGLQYSITAIGSMVMQSANNSLGSVYVSGFTAGMKIKQFTMCPFDALATSVSTFCSQNLGAGHIDRIRRGIRIGFIAGVLYGLGIGVFMILFGRTLSMLFVSAKYGSVLDASAKYLRCMGFFYWVLGLLNVARYTTQGLGYSNRAIFSGVTEMIARCFVSFVFVPYFGYTAICFADQTAWVAASCYIVPTLFFCVKECRAKFQKKLVQ